MVQSVPDIACRDRQLDPGLEFLSFQMGQKRSEHTKQVVTMEGEGRRHGKHRKRSDHVASREGWGGGGRYHQELEFLSFQMGQKRSEHTY